MGMLMNLIRWSTTASILAACAGCGDGASHTCPDPMQPCGPWDAGAGPAACAGACEPPPADDWSSPLLLWIGSPGAEPPCPPEAPHRDYDGHADPGGAPAACPACACSPPTGTCGPPATLTANAAPCPGVGLGVASIPFVSPAEDTCVEGAPLPSSCGAGPCTRSVTVPALSLDETGCAPATEPLPSPQPRDPWWPAVITWQTAARACVLQAPGACSTPGTVCAPAVPAGFSACIRTDGDASCPGSFPTKHTFFDGADDTRDCSPCACGAPVGSLCTGRVSLYEDTTCATQLEAISVASSGSACVDVQPPGAPLASARLSMLAYEPGTCPATGGEPTGSLTPTGPTTFCCRP